jgi:hypothetical protein
MAGATGSTGANGVGMFLSGTSEASVTTIAGGLVGTASVLPLSGYLTSPVNDIPLIGAIPEFPSGGFSGIMQTMPTAVTFTNMTATMSNDVALSLIGTTVTIQVQLYKFPSGGGASSPVPGAICTFAPALTGVIATGTQATCSSTISASYAPGDGAFEVVSTTATGLSLINTVDLDVSVAVSQ